MDTVHRSIKVLEETYLDLEFTAGSFFTMRYTILSFQHAKL